MERNKAWRNAYGRRRTARQKLSLIQARLAAGLDLQSGLKREEVVRLAQLQVYFQEATFAQVARSNPTAIETAFDTVVSDATDELRRSDTTRGYKDAVGDLLTEAVESRAAWLATVDPSPSTSGKVDGDG